MMIYRAVTVLAILTLSLGACTSLEAIPDRDEIMGAVTTTTAPSQTPLPTATFTLRPTDTPVPTLPPTETATPTETPTATPEPSATATPGVLRGKVTGEQMACRFGPGNVYLFKYSVFRDTILEIIGRMEYGNYLLVQAVRGSNPCWVHGDYIEPRGDLNHVPYVDPHVVLAWSPYYGPLSGVSAQRSGDTVTVYWNPLQLRAGDDSEQTPYVVEAWVCQDGEFVFQPVGSYGTAAEVRDEPGCAQPSYGRVFAAEKHGYTQWIRLDWPQPIQPTP
jgi:hypothetical protein